MKNGDHRDADRILSSALDDPQTLSDRDLERALELLESDEKPVRVGVAWVFGIVAADAPGRILPYVPRIADRLDSSELREEVTRALAYVAHATPDGMERELRSMDEETTRRCRNALWGQFASGTEPRTPEHDASKDRHTVDRIESDDWGWLGGGATVAYDVGSEPARLQPSTERPVDPPTVGYEHDRYTPVRSINRSETAESFKVVYRTPDGEIMPGILKRFTTEIDDFRHRFDRRIRMWQSIDDHDAILPVIDWGTDPVPWAVTAYEDVDGVAKLGQNDRLEAAVWTLHRVAEALCFAHGRGVIHGGLTPRSVVRSSILTEPGAWRVPRVTDWGYVDLLQKGPQSGSMPERYFAPEHVDSRSAGGVDGITDVYGFGVVAYEALVGRGPFGSDSPPGGEFSVPTALDRDLPGIESVLRRCLAGRKPERFQTAEEMMTAFRAATEAIDG